MTVVKRWVPGSRLTVIIYDIDGLGVGSQLLLS